MYRNLGNAFKDRGTIFFSDSKLISIMNPGYNYSYDHSWLSQESVGTPSPSYRKRSISAGNSGPFISKEGKTKVQQSSLLPLRFIISLRMSFISQV